MREAGEAMACVPHPEHLLTKKSGRPFLEHVPDRLFGMSGSWTLYRSAKSDPELAWLNPMPSEDELWKAYRNYYTHAAPESEALSWKKRLIAKLRQAFWRRELGYDVALPWWLRAASWLLYLDIDFVAETRHAVMRLPSIKGGLCLEVGYGNGATLRRLAELGWQVEGTDADPSAAQAAAKSGLKVHTGSLLELNLPASSYDAIVLSHVIEHLPRQEQHFNEFHRLLKPGGRLILVTPNIESVGLKLFKDAWVGLDPPRHLYIYSLDSLTTMLSRHGFAVERAFSSVRHTVGNFGASRAIARQGSFAWGAKHPLGLRLVYRLLQYGIAALNLFRKNLGEELCVIAQRA